MTIDRVCERSCPAALILKIETTNASRLIRPKIPYLKVRPFFSRILNFTVPAKTSNLPALYSVSFSAASFLVLDLFPL
jgi:hypothetical protein